MSEISPSLVQHGIYITVNQLQLAILGHLFYSFCPSGLIHGYVDLNIPLVIHIELISRPDGLAALASVALGALEFR